MKKLKVIVSALEIHDSSLVLGKTLPIVKLSFEEAMRFKDHFQSFEELRDFYGSDKVLQEGEEYDGYVAVFYRFRTDVVAMKGLLEKRNDAYLWGSDPDMKSAIEQGRVYFCTCYDGDVPYGGKFRYVWTFGDCRFASTISDLRTRRHLSGEDPEKLSESLKQKVINAAIKDEKFEVTESECLVLKTYLGHYFDDFFIEF